LGVVVDFAAGPAPGLDVRPRWIHGARSPRRCADPPIQTHHCDEHTVMLRQSKAVNYEAPFMYLIFGNDRAIVLDSGATADPQRFPLRSVVDGLVADWLAGHPRERYPLVVAHTHAHHDHIAGDGQFHDRPDTTVVGPAPEEVAEFFGITDWPQQPARFDLGGRVLDVLAIPGHHASSIAVYDPWSQLLITGDTVYPGRLYVSDFPAFLASLDRLVAFADTHEVSHVMGTHVEMTTTPRRDYPIGCTYQPGEAELPMTTDQLRAVRDAAIPLADRPGAHMFDDFAIYHGPCRAAVVTQLMRGALRRIAHL
jgi:glyoxylase-like metal-dependent hydrolase (beta-lactamase superfamily II)